MYYLAFLIVYTPAAKDMTNIPEDYLCFEVFRDQLS